MSQISPEEYAPNSVSKSITRIVNKYKFGISETQYSLTLYQTKDSKYLLNIMVRNDTKREHRYFTGTKEGIQQKMEESEVVSKYTYFWDRVYGEIFPRYTIYPDSNTTNKDYTVGDFQILEEAFPEGQYKKLLRDIYSEYFNPSTLTYRDSPTRSIIPTSEYTISDKSELFIITTGEPISAELSFLIGLRKLYQHSISSLIIPSTLMISKPTPVDKDTVRKGKKVKTVAETELKKRIVNHIRHNNTNACIILNKVQYRQLSDKVKKFIKDSDSHIIIYTDKPKNNLDISWVLRLPNVSCLTRDPNSTNLYVKPPQFIEDITMETFQLQKESSVVDKLENLQFAPFELCIYDRIGMTPPQISLY